MEKVLIDSDIVIDFLRGYNFRLKDFFKKIRDKEIIGLISLISIVELYSGTDIKNKSKLELLEKLLFSLEVTDFDLESAKLAGQWRLRYKLGIPDSLIAVTCFIEKAKLFTFNQKHFKKIKEVRLYQL